MCIPLSGKTSLTIDETRPDKRTVSGKAPVLPNMFASLFGKKSEGLVPPVAPDLTDKLIQEAARAEMTDTRRGRKSTFMKPQQKTLLGGY